MNPELKRPIRITWANRTSNQWLRSDLETSGLRVHTVLKTSEPCHIKAESQICATSAWKCEHSLSLVAPFIHLHLDLCAVTLCCWSTDVSSSVQERMAANLSTLPKPSTYVPSRKPCGNGSTWWAHMQVVQLLWCCKHLLLCEDCIW